MTKKMLLITSLIVLGVASVGFYFQDALQPRHCVTDVQSTEVEIMPPVGPSDMTCFDIPAEAAEFATGGAVKADKSATSEEVSQLLRQYYASLE